MGILNTIQKFKKDIRKLPYLVFHVFLKPFILFFIDPSVGYHIGKKTIQIPLSHNLPLYSLIYPNYSINLGRLASYVHENYPQMTLIDIGANVGDSMAILRKYSSFPILSIEGDIKYFRILEANAKMFTDIHLENSYVSNKENKIRGVIDKTAGTAVLRQKRWGERILTTTLDDILNRNKKFEKSKMIKIDTDGYDFKILEGSINYLIKAKPVIFMEFDPHSLFQQKENPFKGISMLSKLGYKYILIYDNYGDYLINANMTDKNLLSDVHDYFSGRDGNIYCDFCIFHSIDKELFIKIRLLEKGYYAKFRNFSNSR